SIIENNRFQKKKQLWTENPTGEKIFYYQARNAEEEAGFCVSEIERHLAADPASRIAVLYRTNAQSRLFEEYLRRARIEYNIVGGFSFYERQEIKDVISYLKLALNPRDNAAFERVYNTPPRGLGKTTLAKIADHSKASGSSLWESAKVLVTSDSLSIRSKNALLSFIQFIEKIKSKAESDGANQNFVSDLLVSAIEESGYAAMLRAENTEESLGRLENLEELVNAAAEYNANGLDGLREFIDHSALTSDADGIDERSRVTLMTIHAAKGLEFPIVFLVGLEDGIFPHSRSLDDQSELEEERRLAYVAITRAQKLLYLTHAMRRRFYGEDVPSEPSQFLDEIDRTVIEDISDGMSWLSLAAGSHKTSARRPTITNDSESSIKALEAKQPAPPKPIASPKTEWPGKTYNSVEAITEFFRSRAQKLDKKGFQASAPSAQSEPLGQSNDKSTDGYPQRAFLDETTAEKGRPGGSLQNEFAKEPQKPAEKSTPFERLKAFGENAAPSKAENRHQEAFTAGTQVRHEKYGRGLVLRREGSGDNVKLTISFPGYGLKKLIEKYANLQRV
ncbi:MAG TPA: 3'-5' exonuclease, partial [Pyrinomonadaceae bacterium]|nr:3'-5' exonuclease [Pyrinomonadaceae bacterium]